MDKNIQKIITFIMMLIDLSIVGTLICFAYQTMWFGIEIKFERWLIAFICLFVFAYCSMKTAEYFEVDKWY